MKLSISLFVANILLICVGVFGQQVTTRQQPLPLMPGRTAQMHVATSDEVAAASAALSASSASGMAQSRPDRQATNTPQLFCIDVSGNSYDQGVTANAISVGVIPAGSTFFGSVMGTSGNERFLNAWTTDEDIPAGWLWYNLDNGHKQTYTEPGGIITYTMHAIVKGRYYRYTTQKNFGSVGYNRTVLRDGWSSNDYSGPTFYLVGNFGSSVGIVINLPDSYTISVPKEAITFRSGFVTIDGSKIPDSFWPTGDYRFAVTDSTGYSDSGFHIRLNEPSSQGKAQALKRMQEYIGDDNKVRLRQ